MTDQTQTSAPGPYIYKMVQLPQTYVVKKDTEQAIANELNDRVNHFARNGWEFYRIDSVGVAVKPGCLASLLGTRSTMTYYNVVTFRRPKSTVSATPPD